MGVEVAWIAWIAWIARIARIGQHTTGAGTRKTVPATFRGLMPEWLLRMTLSIDRSVRPDLTSKAVSTDLTRR